MKSLPFLEPSLFDLILQSWAYLLPMLVFSCWFSICIWDLLTSKKNKSETGLWIISFFLFPIFSQLSYVLFGKGSLTQSQGITLILSSIVSLILFWVINP